jgi:hypothetical protein
MELDDDTPTCFFCHQKVGIDTFCYGCGAVICARCDINTNLPYGMHNAEDHRRVGKLRMILPDEKPPLFY